MGVHKGHFGSEVSVLSFKRKLTVMGSSEASAYNFWLAHPTWQVQGRSRLQADLSTLTIW
jgi:hypothetical protein